MYLKYFINGFFRNSVFLERLYKYQILQRICGSIKKVESWKKKGDRNVSQESLLKKIFYISRGNSEKYKLNMIQRKLK